MICDSNACTGCGACQYACGFEAITMICDEFGFEYPQINSKSCINCGSCKRVCINNSKPEFRLPKHIYAGCSKEEEIRNTSTSGGIATAISREFILRNGVVFGCTFDKELNLIYKKADRIDQLKCFQGTKYVQSKLGDVFKQVKNEIERGKQVLFIGTPCQVAGILNFMGLKSQNLTAMSFVCGGVPSTKYMKDYISSIYSGRVDDMKFRNNEIYGTVLNFNEKTVFEEKRWHSVYFRAFDEHLSLRESCFHCQFAQKMRVGDITIGDFWGLENSRIFNMEERKKGVSLIMTTTEKGEKLIQEYKDVLLIEEHTLDEACKENPRLLSPTMKNKNVEEFRVRYRKFGFTKAVNSLVGRKYEIYIAKSKLKKYGMLLQMYRKIQKMIRLDC